MKGARCIALSCSHVFCRPCLEDGWRLFIAEGDVAHVGCPDPQCVKDGREAGEEEVRRVVSEEEVRRWRWLRQKRLIEKGTDGVSSCVFLALRVVLTLTDGIDPSMIYCPMSFCQTPVPKPTNAEPGSGWERLRTCPSCDYSFCAYCRRTWYAPSPPPLPPLFPSPNR